MTSSLPSTCQALVCQAIGQPLKLESITTPEAKPGSVVVRVLASPIQHNHNKILSGQIPYMQYPLPWIPGSRAVGRVAAVGVDATSLQVGQLVLIECFVKGRDDPDIQILWAVSQMFSPAAKKFAEDAWRNGLWTEYARVPLENCYAMKEKILLGDSAEGGFGYEIADLPDLATQVIAYGGLRGIGLTAGETIIVAPATGGISGAAVASEQDSKLWSFGECQR